MSPRRKTPRLASKTAQDAFDEAGATQETEGATQETAAVTRSAAATPHAPAAGPGLLHMPTPVLEAILSLLDPESKLSLLAACRTMEAVAQGFPAVWGRSAWLNRGGVLQLQLAEGGASAKRSWLEFLRCRVGALHSLRITSSSLFAPQVAPVLALSAAGPALHSLSLDLHAMAPRQSQRLLKVCSAPIHSFGWLCLRPVTCPDVTCAAPAHPAPPATLQAVGALTGLRQLDLEAAPLDHGCWDVSGAELLLALRPLSALQRLHINAYFRGDGALPATVFDSLGHLSSLTLRQLLYAAEPTLAGAALGAAGAAVGGLRFLDLCGFRLAATAAEVSGSLPRLHTLRLHHVWAEESTFGALPQLLELTTVTLTGGIFHQPSQVRAASGGTRAGPGWDELPLKSFTHAS